MLPTPILQSLVSRNRSAITSSHNLITYYKFYAKENPAEMNVYYCHLQVGKLTKDIKKLAAIQVSLKKEIGRALVEQRIATQYADVIGNAKAMADECY